MQELPALLRCDGQGQHGVLRPGLRQQGPHLPGDRGYQHMDAAQAGRRGVQGISQRVQKAFRPHQRRQVDQERVLRLERGGQKEKRGLRWRHDHTRGIFPLAEGVVRNVEQRNKSTMTCSSAFSLIMALQDLNDFLIPLSPVCFCNPFPKLPSM